MHIQVFTEKPSHDPVPHGGTAAMAMGCDLSEPSIKGTRVTYVTNFGDGCIRKCISESTFWMVVCEARMVWWSGWVSETDWGALARLPETIQVGQRNHRCSHGRAVWWRTVTRLGRHRVPKRGLGVRSNTYLAPRLSRGHRRRHIQNDG